MDSAAAPSIYNLECPISIQWTIAEEKLAALKDSTTYGYLETEKFNASNIPGVKYYLRIFHNGIKEQYRGKVGIILYLLLGNETKIKADVKFLVDPACYSFTLKYEYTKAWGWGDNMCTSVELFDLAKNFIVDGKFTLKCEGTLSVEREMLTTNGINFGDELVGHKLWKKDDKDFTIKVGEDCIKAHKFILAAHSPVFEAMFHHSGMKEPNENHMDITDFKFKVVESAVHLCYNCEPSYYLKLEDQMELLQFFDKYDMDSLKASCEASLIRDVSVSNVCQLANSSMVSNSLKLQEKCAEFLIQCINSKTPIADFDILDNDFLRKVTET